MQRAAGGTPSTPAPVPASHRPVQTQMPQQPTPTAPMRPVSGAPTGAPPVNLPTMPSPRPPVAPITPPRPTPPTPAPAPVTIPGISVIPQPKSPPPAPREVPVAPMPSIPSPPAPQPPPPPTAPTPPKPVAIVPPPAPVSPVISTKTPPPVSPPTGRADTQEGYSAELRTMSADIGNIKVGQAPVGIKQPTPTAPVPGAPVVAPKTPGIPTIVIPEAGTSGRGMSRKMIYGIIGAIALIGIAYALVSMIGSGSSPQVSASPSPLISGSPAPTLGGKNLRSYFGNPGKSIDLQTSTTGLNDLLNALVSVQPAMKQATSLAINHQGSAATALVFFADIAITVPADLSASIGSDWALLAYGQSEAFDSAGAKITATSSSVRLVVVLELSDATKANQAMQVWENAGLESAGAGLMQYDTTKRLVTSFGGGTYRQIPVRYWNFPYADRSIDYAIVTASNNKNYLVLAGSREAAFFAIDQLMQ